MCSSKYRIAATFLAVMLCAPISAQVTQRVSVATGGAQGNSASGYPSISADGRFVAFFSDASNFVAGDTNGTDDVFVRDRQLGTTERVSVATGGAQGNNESRAPSISADGRFVAFQSAASNLVAGDTNGTDDVFVRDRQLGTTARVSLATGGAQGNSVSAEPSISADGRFVAFYSNASNLVAGDTNPDYDVFVRDRQLGTTERVSVVTGGAQANERSFLPSISADGRFVAFESFASNLVAGDTNMLFDTFVRDRQSGTTERVSVTTGGAQGNSDSGSPSISADGRFVAFRSNATNLVAGDTMAPDIFVRDRQSGTTERVSVATGGGQGNAHSSQPSISADGRFVAFLSAASNLVAGDTNADSDVFVHDRQLGTTERVSMATGGAQGNDGSFNTSISADGRFVAFHSYATNLVAGDTNGFIDVFVRDRSPASTIAAFCFGDGTGTACPCSNTGNTGRGCKSSAASSIGCLLSAVDSGGNPNPSTSVTANDLGLKSEGMNMGSYCIFFQGTGNVASGLGGLSPNFDGLECVGGTIVRLGRITTMGGTNTLAGVAGVAGLSATAQTLVYQTAYRNAAPFCTPATLNTSNALQVSWAP